MLAISLVLGAGSRNLQAGPSTSRENWNFQTTVGAYQKVGRTNSAWDKAAIAALNAFASISSGITSPEGSRRGIIATNCALAVKAGCDDPFIEFLFALTDADRESDKAASAEKLLTATTKLQKSSYPAIRKYQATVSALAACYRAFKDEAYLQKIKGLTLPNDYLPEILNDAEIPVAEAYMICDRTLKAAEDIDDLKRYEKVYRILERPMGSRWPNEYQTWLVKGRAYTKMAWLHRGDGTADTVTTEGRKGFRDCLDTAQTALTNGWRLNHTNTEIPLQMMTVSLGYEESGRDMIETWFENAMEVDSNCVAACRSKLYYLEPKWYGGWGADYLQLAFGRECVESTNWGGRVPLMLVEVHDGIAERKEGTKQKEYWTNNPVWLDVREAFDRYLKQNPDDTDEYYSYVRYAIKCERWDKVKELLPKLEPVDYEFFGGKERYDKIVAAANELGPKTRPLQLTLMVDGQRAFARLLNRLNFWMLTKAESDQAFEAYESVLKKYPTAPASQRAQILLNEASLCKIKPLFYERAWQVYTRVKMEFPGTKAAAEAGQKLIELQQKAKKDEKPTSPRPKNVI